MFVKAISSSSWCQRFISGMPQARVREDLPVTVALVALHERGDE
jgi:hypothetical protein